MRQSLIVPMQHKLNPRLSLIYVVGIECFQKTFYFPSQICVCVFVCVGQIVRLMTSSFLTPSKVMCLCSLVVSPWRYVSCQHDGQRADEKNSEAEGGVNRKDGQKQEGGQVHLNVILIRRPLPFLINKIFVIGKVVVARSRPLGL